MLLFRLRYQSRNSTFFSTLLKTFLVLYYSLSFIPSRLKVTACFAFLYVLNAERFKTSSDRSFLERGCLCELCHFRSYGEGL